jgi:DNA repair exonuclease SbcCD nuclease subunit
MKNLVDFALEEKVDFLVIAGDIYDGDWSDYATGHVFLDQMRRLAPTPVSVDSVSPRVGFGATGQSQGSS